MNTRKLIYLKINSEPIQHIEKPCQKLTELGPFISKFQLKIRGMNRIEYFLEYNNTFLPILL
jgi:hypothetical protein